MIVTAWATAVPTWPRASHQPAITNQITLPSVLIAPPARVSTTSRPKGQITKPAIRNEARPKGMVMRKMQARTPASR